MFSTEMYWKSTLVKVEKEKGIEKCKKEIGIAKNSEMGY